MTSDSGSVAPPTGSAVEIRLSKLQQLFNSFDPSPFHERELDPAAEDYIVGSVDELPLAQPLKLVIHLPSDQMVPGEMQWVQEAVHSYFAYRLAETKRKMRFQLREGRISLLIGLAFLFACMTARQFTTSMGGAASQILAESFLILGWVAMWRPLQIFLYDWWPIRHHARLHAKLAAMPVEIRAERSQTKRLGQADFDHH